MARSKIHTGGCLCGALRFEADAPAARPHTCSCKMCQRHTGALTATWVEFPRDAVRWVGQGGAPAVWRSSDISSRAFCSQCGSSLGAVDDAPTIALLLGCFDRQGSIELRPTFHSYTSTRPKWWCVEIR
ncbi:glutathione-dependent formaldehyde-activating GFA [Rhizobium sp. PDO1-076]|uniref:GFA family protein n=1 Tax=Rhizobium sp. PDO1-076 TaxID=1125979 RepID=UPI00024E27CB|nr:GFA family protein [Rhizobium sp. PDO1-076]EHS50454.1 glutathione-dependent formaldehyde-activating GFA [Rhizobium sp. PDO1-076]